MEFLYYEFEALHHIEKGIFRTWLLEPVDCFLISRLLVSNVEEL